jgi:transposase-like protein
MAALGRDGGEALMARSKATPARIEALLGALGTGCTRRAACAHVGIDQSTLYRWLLDYRLRASVERAEADFAVRCVEQIQEAALTDWDAAAWLLERRFPVRCEPPVAERA